MDVRPLAYFVYRTEHGALSICVAKEGVRNVAFGDVPFDAPRRPTALSNAASTQIMEYLAGKRRSFDVPLALAGTAFQQAVWEEVGRIPYGETRTARDIAREIGQPTSYRAVGAAVRENPLPILIPTHRIVKSDGRPYDTGSNGHIGSALLRMESETKSLQL